MRIYQCVSAPNTKLRPMTIVHPGYPGSSNAFPSGPSQRRMDHAHRQQKVLNDFVDAHMNGELQKCGPAACRDPEFWAREGASSLANSWPGYTLIMWELPGCRSSTTSPGAVGALDAQEDCSVCAFARSANHRAALRSPLLRQRSARWPPGGHPHIPRRRWSDWVESARGDAVSVDDPRRILRESLERER